MKKAVIDLDWLNGEIDKLRNKGANSKTEEKLDFREERTLLKVLSKCIPIEEPKELFLSKTCVNNWENNKFCENNGKCELCKIKQ